MGKMQYKIECILCGKLQGYGSIDPGSPGQKTTGYCKPCHDKMNSLPIRIPNVALENREKAAKVVEMVEQGKISSADAIIQLGNILSKRSS
jgi:hypothetical protein